MIFGEHEIVIRSTIVELGLYGDEYDEFVRELQAQGLPVRLDDERTELRHIDPGSIDAAAQIGIWIGEHVSEIADAITIAEIIRRAAKHTISKRKRARKTQPVGRLPIYGANGEIISSVDLPAGDEDE